MPSVVQALLLTAKGEVKQAKVSLRGTELANADIQKYLKKKTGADEHSSSWYRSELKCVSESRSNHNGVTKQTNS